MWIMELRAINHLSDSRCDVYLFSLVRGLVQAFYSLTDNKLGTFLNQQANVFAVDSKTTQLRIFSKLHYFNRP